MITQDTQELVVSGVTFMVMGMFLGNLILIVLGLFPIVFLDLGILIWQPQEVTVTREGEDAKVWADNQIADTPTATVTLSASKSSRPVSLKQVASLPMPTVSIAGAKVVVRFLDA